MAKEYPLDVERLRELEGEYTIGYYSKGHHDYVEFLEALIDGFDVLKSHPKTHEDYILANTEHRWAKLVPWRGGGTMITYSDTYKKGYFPITEVEIG